MTEQLFIFVRDTPFEVLFLVISLGMLRTLGLSFGFMAFNWGLGTSITVRAGIAMAIGSPLMLANLDTVIEISNSATRFELAVLSPKEFAIGYGLGILASLPFLVMQYAGAVTDSFRGESDSGIQDPSGGTFQTFSVFYVVIAFFVFFSMGGLWDLFANLYRSYEIWPLETLYPKLGADAGLTALQLLDDTMHSAVLVAGPLLIILMAIELILIVAAKLARKFGLYDLSFLAKNAVAILSLPLLAIFILKMSNELTPEAIENLRKFEGFFQ